MCEGWSLEIGTAYRGAVVRHDRIDQPPTWLASLNITNLGEYFDRESAMARVEESLQRDMNLALYDWAQYQAGKSCSR